MSKPSDGTPWEFTLDAVHEPERMFRQEWLLTNGLGGFAMGTPSGVPCRRYHAWLVAATAPPGGRVVALSGTVEKLTLQAAGREQVLDLSTFLFASSNEGSVLHPDGHHLLEKFELCRERNAVRWTYRWGEVEVVRELELERDANTVRLRYSLDSAGFPARLSVRPLVAMRDFHGLIRARESWDRFRVAEVFGEIEVDADGQALSMVCPGARFTANAGWWENFLYSFDRERGQDCVEDLFAPGEFTAEIPGSIGRRSIELVVRLARSATPARSSARAAAPVWAVGRPELMPLIRAADQFVVHRDDVAGSGVSVIAGYPWFSDWGRDTCISLPGLLIATGRLEEARRTLESFAGLMQDGLIPNCFDNGSGRPEYNTADASLWFIHSACAYAREAGKRGPLMPPALAHACLAIVDAYRAGTKFGIRVDPEDGLVSAGDETTQLTWMDAKRNGVVFTPRSGKPVELSALWRSGLMHLAEVIGPDHPRLARELRQLAELTGASMRAKFWNNAAGCLFDVIGRDGKPDGSIRPNQILAVSLPHSALTPVQRRAVISVVSDRLLTPVGLRTLAPEDPGYVGRYRGDLFVRDRAYHNGTVWPWLIGPYAEAVMRADGFSDESRGRAETLLLPLLEFMRGPGLGQLPEVFDGDDTPAEPRASGGCPAQAWSVAEVMRVLGLVRSADPEANG